MIWIVFLITMLNGQPVMGNILQAPDREMCIDVRDQVQRLVPEGVEVFCEGVKLTNGGLSRRT